MAFEQQQVGTVQIIRLVGRLDSGNAPELEAAVRESLAAGASRLLFDFAALDYISSAGLRVVLVAGKALRGQSPAGRLAMCGLRGMVLEVFEMSGFLNLFPVADDREAALAQLQA